MNNAKSTKPCVPEHCGRCGAYPCCGIVVGPQMLRAEWRVWCDCDETMKVAAPTKARAIAAWRRMMKTKKRKTNAKRP